MKTAKHIHPDIHFSFPSISIKKDRPTISNDLISEWRGFLDKEPYGNVYDWLQWIKAENKQGNITALECEEVIRKINLKSFESEYKILIMWMPEFLGKEGNKLLKLIEEPPANTLFIFVAESEQGILPTILSRTQLIKIPVFEEHDVADALVKHHGLSAEEAAQIASLSSGNMHEALSLMQHAEENWESMLRTWLNSIIKGGPAAQVAWIEDISKYGREKQKQFLRYFIHLLEHSVRLSAGISPVSSENPTNNMAAGVIDFAGRFNRLCNVHQLDAIIQELDTAIYHIERNGNPKILFHALTIRVYRIISDNSVILVN
jgi:DNA polymerase-3 subunit delta'